MGRYVLVALIGIIGFLIFAVAFVLISIGVDNLYYAIGPNIRFGPLPLPGPTGVPMRGIEDVVGVIIYVSLILAAVVAFVILLIQLFGNWPDRGPRRLHEDRAA